MERRALGPTTTKCAEDLVRRYFSQVLDKKKDKVGLRLLECKLCLPTHVQALLYFCELMSVIAGLVMFFGAYLLRFATSPLVMGASSPTFR